MVIVLMVSLMGGYLWWETSRGAEVTWRGGLIQDQVVDNQSRPTPAPATSDIPLGIPDPPPTTGGKYQFIATQPNSAAPVTYDPCRPINMVINERTMPSTATGVVEEALNELSGISGFRFNIEGYTDEGPSKNRKPFQPERYGDRWAPVLIAWSDADEHGELGENVAGLGGSARIQVSRSHHVYVSGIVYLDGDDAARMVTHDNGRAYVKAVVLHELGHLIGLGHVDDPGELMNESNTGLFGYGNGDLTGIAALARGQCEENL